MYPGHDWLSVLSKGYKENKFGAMGKIRAHKLLLGKTLIREKLPENK
jgi:hypothetical protein